MNSPHQDNSLSTSRRTFRFRPQLLLMEERSMPGSMLGEIGSAYLIPTETILSSAQMSSQTVTSPPDLISLDPSQSMVYSPSADSSTTSSLFDLPLSESFSSQQSSDEFTSDGEHRLLSSLLANITLNQSSLADLWSVAMTTGGGGTSDSLSVDTDAAGFIESITDGATPTEQVDSESSPTNNSSESTSAQDMTESPNPISNRPDSPTSEDNNPINPPNPQSFLNNVPSTQTPVSLLNNPAVINPTSAEGGPDSQAGSSQNDSPNSEQGLNPADFSNELQTNDYFGRSSPMDQNRNGTPLSPEGLAADGSFDGSGYNLQFGMLSGSDSPTSSDPFNMPTNSNFFNISQPGLLSRNLNNTSFNPGTLGMGEWLYGRMPSDGSTTPTTQWDSPLYDSSPSEDLTPFFVLHGGNFSPWFTVATGVTLPAESGSQTFTLINYTFGTTTEEVTETWTITRDEENGTFTLVETVDVVFSRIQDTTVNGVTTHTVYSGVDELVLEATGTYTPFSFTITSFELSENGTELYEIDRQKQTPTDSFTLALESSDTFHLGGFGKSFDGTLGFHSFSVTKDGKETYQLTRFQDFGTSQDTFVASGTDTFRLDFQALNASRPWQQSGSSGHDLEMEFEGEFPNEGNSTTNGNELSFSSFQLQKTGRETFQVNQTGLNSFTSTNSQTNETTSSLQSFNAEAIGHQTFQIQHKSLSASNGLFKSEYLVNKTGDESFQLNRHEEVTKTTADANPRQLSQDSFTTHSNGSDTFVVAAKRLRIQAPYNNETILPVDAEVTALLKASRVESNGGLSLSSVTVDKTGTESFTFSQTYQETPGNSETNVTQNAEGSNTFHLQEYHFEGTGTGSLTSYQLNPGDGQAVAIAHIESEGTGKLSSFVLDQTGTESYTTDVSGWIRNGGGSGEFPELELAEGNGANTLDSFHDIYQGSGPFSIHIEEVIVHPTSNYAPSSYQLVSYQLQGTGVPTLNLDAQQGTEQGNLILASFTLDPNTLPSDIPSGSLGTGTITGEGFQIQGSGHDRREVSSRSGHETFSSERTRTENSTTTQTTNGVTETVTTDRSNAVRKSGNNDYQTTTEQYEAGGSFQFAKYGLGFGNGTAQISTSGELLQGQLSLISYSMNKTGTETRFNEKTEAIHKESVTSVTDSYLHSTSTGGGPFTEQSHRIQGNGDIHIQRIGSNSSGNQSNQSSSTAVGFDGSQSLVSASFGVQWTGNPTQGNSSFTADVIDAYGSIVMERTTVTSSGHEEFISHFDQHRITQNSNGLLPDISHVTMNSSGNNDYVETVSAIEANTSFGYLHQGVDRQFTFKKGSQTQNSSGGDRLSVSGRTAMIESDLYITQGTDIVQNNIDSTTHRLTSTPDGKQKRTSDHSLVSTSEENHYTQHVYSLLANNEYGATFTVWSEDPAPHFRLDEASGSGVGSGNNLNANAQMQQDSYSATFANFGFSTNGSNGSAGGAQADGGGLKVDGIVNLVQFAGTNSGPQTFQVHSVGTSTITGTGHDGLYENSIIEYDLRSNGTNTTNSQSAELRVNLNYDPGYSSYLPAFTMSGFTVEDGQMTAGHTRVVGVGQMTETTDSDIGTNTFRVDMQGTFTHSGTDNNGFTRSSVSNLEELETGTDNFTSDRYDFNASGELAMVTARITNAANGVQLGLTSSVENQSSESNISAQAPNDPSRSLISTAGGGSTPDGSSYTTTATAPNNSGIRVSSLEIHGSGSSKTAESTNIGTTHHNSRTTGSSAMAKLDANTDTDIVQTASYVLDEQGTNNYNQSQFFSTANGSSFLYDFRNASQINGVPAVSLAHQTSNGFVTVYHTTRTDTGNSTSSIDETVTTDIAHPVAGGTSHTDRHEVHHNNTPNYRQFSDIRFGEGGGSFRSDVIGIGVSDSNEVLSQGEKHLIVVQSGNSVRHDTENTTVHNHKTLPGGSWTDTTDHFDTIRDSTNTYNMNFRADKVINGNGGMAISSYTLTQSATGTYDITHTGTSGWLYLNGEAGSGGGEGVQEVAHGGGRPGDREEGIENFTSHRTGSETSSEREGGVQVNGTLSISSFVRDDEGNEDYDITQSVTTRWHFTTDNRGSTDDGVHSFTLVKNSQTQFNDHVEGAQVSGLFQVTQSVYDESGTGFRDRIDQENRYTHTIKENLLSTEDVGVTSLKRTTSNDSFTKHGEGADVNNTFSLSSFVMEMESDQQLRTVIGKVRGWHDVSGGIVPVAGEGPPPEVSTKDGIASTTLITEGTIQSREQLSGSDVNGLFQSHSHKISNAQNSFTLNEQIYEIWQDRFNGNREDGVTTFLLTSNGTNTLQTETDNQSLGDTISATTGTAFASGKTNYVRTNSVDKTWYTRKPSPNPLPSGNDTIPYEEGSRNSTRTTTGTKENIGTQASQEINNVWSVSDSYYMVRVQETYVENTDQSIHIHEVTSKGSTEDSTETISLTKNGLDSYTTQQRGAVAGGFSYSQTIVDEESSETFEMTKDQTRRWHNILDDNGSWERGLTTTNIGMIDGNSSFKLHKELEGGSGGESVISFVFDSFSQENISESHGDGTGSSHFAGYNGSARDVTDTFTTDQNGSQIITTHLSGRQHADGKFRADSFRTTRDTISHVEFEKTSYESYTGFAGESGAMEGEGMLHSVAFDDPSRSHGWKRTELKRIADEVGSIIQEGSDQGQGLTLTTTVDRTTDEEYDLKNYKSHTQDPPATTPDTSNMQPGTKYNESGNSLFTLEVSGYNNSTIHQEIYGGMGGGEGAIPIPVQGGGSQQGTGPIQVEPGPNQVRGVQLEYSSEPTSITSFQLDQVGGETFTIDQFTRKDWKFWTGASGEDGFESQTMYKEGEHEFDMHKEAKDVNSRFSIQLFRLTQSGFETVEFARDGKTPQGQKIASLSSGRGNVSFHMEGTSTDSFQIFQEGKDRGETYVHDSFTLDQDYHGTTHVDQFSTSVTELVGYTMNGEEPVPSQNYASVRHTQTFDYHADTVNHFRIHAAGHTGDDYKFILSAMSLTNDGHESYTKTEDSHYTWRAPESVGGESVEMSGLATYHVDTNGKNWYDLYSEGYDQNGSFTLESFRLEAGGWESLSYSGYAQKVRTTIPEYGIISANVEFYFGRDIRNHPVPEIRRTPLRHTEDSYTIVQELGVTHELTTGPSNTGQENPSIPVALGSPYDFHFTFDRSVTEKTKTEDETVSYLPTAFSYNKDFRDSVVTATYHQEGDMIGGRASVESMRLYEEGLSTFDSMNFGVNFTDQKLYKTEQFSTHSFTLEETYEEEGTHTLWDETSTSSYTHQNVEPHKYERTQSRDTFTYFSDYIKQPDNFVKVNEFRFDAIGQLTFHSESSYSYQGEAPLENSSSWSQTGDTIRSYHLNEKGSTHSDRSLHVDSFVWNADATSTWVYVSNSTFGTTSDSSRDTAVFFRHEDANGSDSHYSFQVNWREENWHHSLNTRTDANDSFRHESDSHSKVTLDEKGTNTNGVINISSFVYSNSGESWNDSKTYRYTSYSGEDSSGSNTDNTKSHSTYTYSERLEGSKINGVFTVSNLKRNRTSDSIADQWGSASHTSPEGGGSSQYDAHQEVHTVHRAEGSYAGGVVSLTDYYDSDIRSDYANSSGSGPNYSYSSHSDHYNSTITSGAGDAFTTTSNWSWNTSSTTTSNGQTTSESDGDSGSWEGDGYANEPAPGDPTEGFAAPLHFVGGEGGMLVGGFMGGLLGWMYGRGIPGGLNGSIPYLAMNNARTRVMEESTFLTGLGAGPAAIAEIFKLADALRPAFNAVGAKVAHGEAVNIHATWTALHPLLVVGQSKISKAIFDAIEAGKTTQRDFLAWRNGLGIPNVAPVQLGGKRTVNNEDLIAVTEELLRSGRTLFAGALPIYGGPGANMNAAQAWITAVGMSAQVVMIAAGAGMLPLAAGGWVAGLGLLSAYGSVATGAYIGASIGSAIVGGYWGYVTTEIRNPNATNGEKLLGAVMGGVFGFLSPLATIGQVIGGITLYANATERGVSHEKAVSEMGKGEVIGGIIGGALQAGLLGWAGSGRQAGTLVIAGGDGHLVGGVSRSFGSGLAAGLSAAIADAGGAFIGYQVYQALGMDPWDGANMGMMFMGIARSALDGANSLKSTRTGNNVIENLRTVMRGGRGEEGERWSLLAIDRQMQAREHAEGQKALREVFEKTAKGHDNDVQNTRGREGGVDGESALKAVDQQTARQLEQGAENCFAAGTPLLTADGSKLIEMIRVGDMVLTKDQYNPNAELEYKEVEKIFRRSSQIMHVHVNGQVIRTTHEHPFFVRGKGWIAASSLQQGDLLSSHDGQWVAVEQVFDTQQYEVVYNLRVADHHTYFVGDLFWGFSVWAHNVYIPLDPNESSYWHVSEEDGAFTLNNHQAVAHYLRDNVLAHRLENPDIPLGRNLAAYLVLSPDGTTLQVRVFESNSANPHDHAEQVGWRALQQEGITRDQIMAVYSERIPCRYREGHEYCPGCTNFLTNDPNGPMLNWQSQVHYSSQRFTTNADMRIRINNVLTRMRNDIAAGHDPWGN